MIKKIVSPLILGIVALSALALPRVLTPVQPEEQKQKLGVLDNVTNPVVKAPAETIQGKDFFFEDFESTSDGSLPSGWTVSPTPGNHEDVWRVGTIQTEGEQVYAPSGVQYAYLFANGVSAHDTWMITPGIEMEAGKEYKIMFYCWAVSYSSVVEELEVAVGTSAEAAAMTEIVGSVEDNTGEWMAYTVKFIPKQTDTYYVGFHNKTALNDEFYSGMLIDNVKVYAGELPLFYGNTYLNMGETEIMESSLMYSDIISNYGDGTLKVSLKSVSEGLSVSGFPMELAPGGSGTYGIVLDPEKTGDYTGQIVLATNDPTCPEVTVNVTAKVNDSRVTGYNFENFENGGPEGWKLSEGMVNSGEFTGHNSLRCLYASTFYMQLSGNEDGMWFTTHFVEMGDKPEFSFWYKLTDSDYFGSLNGPTSADRVEIKVMVSDDGGETWNCEYTIGPDGDEAHIPSSDYRKVTVNLDEYAGKCCRVKVLFKQLDGDYFMNMVQVLVDDVAIGTPISNDLKADYLTGDNILEAGATGKAVVGIENLGAEEVSSYTVRLIDRKDNKEIARKDGTAVGSMEKATVELEFALADTGRHDIYAEVTIDNDETPDNNVSNDMFIDVLSENNSEKIFDEGKAVAGSMYPINFGYETFVSQTIYKANDIGLSKAEISSVVYSYNIKDIFKSEPFEVFVGETDKDDFSDNTLIDADKLVKVFDSSVTFKAGAGELVIPFDKPYNYNGGNLVIMCRKVSDEWVNGIDFNLRSEQPYISSISCSIDDEGNYTNMSATNAMPVTRFNLVAAPSGSLKGNVSFSDKKGVQTTVRVDGTKLSAVTDDEGNYEIKNLAEGDYKISFDAHGYYPLTGQAVKIAANTSATLNVTMNALPQYKVTGKVTDSSTGNPLGGITVQLNGYHQYSAETAADGSFSFDGVYADTGTDYVLTTTSTHFDNYAHRFALKDADYSHNVSLEASPLRPQDVSATAADGAATVKWAPGKGELRHDTGIYNGCLGYSWGMWCVIFGTSYHCKATVSEVSWYVTDKEGPHSNFNVFIFGLDENGLPNAKDILYEAYNVPYKDNDWSVHILPQPVEADGFMVAISCDGFMGIGTTAPTDEYPFTEGMHYYVGESFTMGIFDMALFQPSHLMIRATVDEENPASSEPTYDVYRLTDGDAREDWTFVGSTQGLSISDPDFARYDNGKIRYAVVARYGQKESSAVMSDIVDATTGIGSETSAGSVTVRQDGDMLDISSDDPVARISVVTLQGIVALQQDEPGASVDISGLAPDVYIVNVTTAGGDVVTRKMVIR